MGVWPKIRQGLGCGQLGRATADTPSPPGRLGMVAVVAGQR